MNQYVKIAAPVVTRIVSPDRLAGELPVWDGTALAASARTPMQTRDWIMACAETLGGGDVEIVFIEDDRGVAAIAPLIRRRSAPTVREFLGARELGEPSDFIYRDEAALALLVDALARDRARCDFRRLPACSPSVAQIRKAQHGFGIVRTTATNACPRIAIPDDGTDAEQLLSSRLRSDLRRAQRKAEALGAVACEIFAPRSASEFAPLYAQALEVEAAGWKGVRGSALAKNETLKDFFHRYGELASESGALRIAFLRIDGNAAAMQYAVEWSGALWLLKVGYDETYASCSPGQLLMLHTLRDAARRGLRSFEFLGGEDSWTRRWTRDGMSTVGVRVYPYGPLNLLVFGRDLLASAREKIAAPRASTAVRGRGR